MGNDGLDLLDGGEGNDILKGGLGNDTLTGGLGNDRFVFKEATEKVDTITDFTSGADQLRISASGFGGGLTPGVLNADQFVIGAAPKDADDRFIYSGGKLFYDADGLGGATKFQIALLTGAPTLVASDITIF